MGLVRNARSREDSLARGSWNKLSKFFKRRAEKIEKSTRYFNFENFAEKFFQIFFMNPGYDYYNLLVEVRDDPMSKSCNDCERLFTAEHKKGQELIFELSENIPTHLILFFCQFGKTIIFE